MNKKAIFTPLFVIFILIILSTSIFIIKIKEEGKIGEFSISSQTQQEIINIYMQYEKDIYFYEKLTEVKEYESIKEFADTVPEIEGSFNFREHFTNILKKNLKDYSQEIDLKSSMDINFGEKTYKIEKANLNLEYKKQMKVSKKPIIDFSYLDSLNKEGSYKIAEITNENGQIEEVYLNLKYKSIF